MIFAKNSLALSLIIFSSLCEEKTMVLTIYKTKSVSLEILKKRFPECEITEDTDYFYIEKRKVKNA